MRIHHDGRVLETHCDGGCYCHHMAAIVGGDPERGLCGCGCPKTAEAFRRLEAERDKYAQTDRARRAPGPKQGGAKRG